MIGVEVKWFLLDGCWWCELRKQLGPEILSIKKSVGSAPTPSMCLFQEEQGKAELEAELDRIRSGRF